MNVQELIELKEQLDEANSTVVYYFGYTKEGVKKIFVDTNKLKVCQNEVKFTDNLEKYFEKIIRDLEEKHKEFNEISVFFKFNNCHKLYGGNSLDFFVGELERYDVFYIDEYGAKMDVIRNAYIRDEDNQSYVVSCEELKKELSKRGFNTSNVVFGYLEKSSVSVNFEKSKVKVYGK